MFTELYRYPCYDRIDKNIRSRINTAVFGAPESEAAFVVAGLKNFAVVVAADYLVAKKVVRDINAFGGNFEYLPFDDDVLIYKKNTARSFAVQRARALSRMLSGKGGVVLSAEALLRLYPDIKRFRESCFVIDAKTSISPQMLSSRLIAAGYSREAMVSARGEFSLRGDILDIFTPFGDYPIRVEFFDDTPERLRYFDLENQTSIGEAECVEVAPLCDIFPDDAPQALEMLNREIDRTKVTSDAVARLKSIYSELTIEKDGSWLLPYATYSTLNDYLPQSAVIVWIEPKHIADRADRLFNEHSARCGYLLERGELTRVGVENLPDAKEALSFNSKNGCGLSFQKIATSAFFSANDTVNLHSSETMNYRQNLDMLARDIKDWLADGYKVGVFAGNSENAVKLRDSLSDRNVDLSVLENFNDTLINGSIIASELEDGFISRSAKLVLIGQSKLYAAASHKKLRNTGKKVFLAVEAGDYVVHETHGIGLCAGVTTIKGECGDKDYIVVKYRNNDTLYVPVESSNLLCKYSGAETAPRLSMLGGGEFEKVKQKVKAKIKEMTVDLVKLYGERTKQRGFRYQEDGYLEEAFAEAFPYKETEDQLRCIEEINKDLTSDKIMDRLLVGDVGFGKTEVAMRATFKVAANGRQALVLAPTTILSEQHSKTFSERFAPFNIKVVCLNRFRTKEETDKIYKEIESGKAEVIVGTHKLLNKKIKYKDMGLLVLDEEQRFGVEHKELLKTVKTNVDVLSMSATPIPRTLHMALTGIRDISTINTPPKERLPVESFVVEDSPALLRDVILRELSRNGQIFIVYNRVDTIESFSARVRETVPEARITVAHGQMPERELENAVARFAAAETDILVCTTIIENGIDMPNANTLIVYDADNLGLSQLYQLKGRVGRGNRPAFAYFVYRESKVLSDVAYKRLTSIMENTELGSGFKIAMKDLEIRGAGNVLGREQHGHMEKVGYDMYVKLLEEVIGEAQGKKIYNQGEVVMDVDIDAHVPTGYIDDGEARMAFYQRMSAIGNRKEKATLIGELKDIYGQPPKPVLNLLDLAELKSLCAKQGVDKVVIRKNTVKLVGEAREGLMRAVPVFNKIIKLETEGKGLQVVFNLKGKGTRYALTAVRAFLETAEENAAV